MRRPGDRRDAKLLRDIDSMHFIMPLMYPNRCDNEAFISETIDLTNVMKYLEKKNAEGPDYKYNFFQVMVTAVLKTITLRPQLNRFIANYNLYERNEVSAAFTIKKIFKDDGDEALAFIHSKPTDNLESIHNEIYRQVSYVRHEGKDQSTMSMDALQKVFGFPPLKKALGVGARFLDKRGLMPASVIATDPFQSSVVLANLGSIKLRSGYHHLTNWGTTSVFVIIGEMKERPFYNEDGREEMRMSVDIGLTVDERISDGYYCSRSIKLLKHLLDQPELLELPLGEKVDY
ncbi:MAG: 2-oxo acid dehydrogenase subunit E2 [Mogibacterium sp.]|nr:2-oxo acid dehydrogenase subunit E2 [Mogibacterium sp.]